MSCRENLVHFLSAQIKQRTEKIQILFLSWSFSWISDKASEELFRQRPERKVEAIFLTATEKLKVIGNCIEECGMLVELGRVDGKIMNNWNFGRFCHSAINTELLSHWPINGFIIERVISVLLLITQNIINGLAVRPIQHSVQQYIMILIID